MERESGQNFDVNKEKDSQTLDNDSSKALPERGFAPGSAWLASDKTFDDPDY